MARQYGPVVAVVGTGLIAACNADDGSGRTPEETGKGTADSGGTVMGDESAWSCRETATACSCYPEQPGVVERGGSGRDVSRCLGFECCLLTEGEDSSCQCLADGTNCDAEAASRRGTTVVSACPPGAESLPVACAEVAENCELAYLQQQGFEDCCDGSVCDLGANGIRICRVATDEEVRRARECRRAAYSGTDNVVFEPVAIATSVGTLTFTDLFTAQGLVGPGGCINGASMRLSDGGLCSLELTAGLVDGALAVTSVDANLHNCSGYEGSEAFLYIDEVDPANIPFAVSIDAISCDWGGGFEGYCTSGEITWTLQGTLAGITFEAMSIPLTGVTCVAQPAGDCPP